MATNATVTKVANSYACSSISSDHQGARTVFGRGNGRNNGRGEGGRNTGRTAPPERTKNSKAKILNPYACPQGLQEIETEGS